MSAKTTLSFQISPDLMVGVNRLQARLDFEIGDGIVVTAVQGNRIGVSLEDGKATIYYNKKNQFFRELGILIERAQKESAFDVTEDGFFESISTMIDTSRCGVPTIPSICEMIDYLAVMGYDMAMLYTEDTVTLESRPYFGYMRGRYTCEQLKEIDDYAFEYGIEVIPCLECYGHMEKYLMWREARPIKDTAGVLLAREEATFDFVDELIRTVSSCFRSKRIHIGMDEAWDMGRGKFLDKHGYVSPYEIFNEYMERLMQIVNKYGLTAMMWSDMYFRMSDPSHLYYEENVVVPPEVIAKIPEGIELVFWHYGEKPWCDDYMLKKHQAIGRKTIYAGGLWSWIGHFPEHNYMMETVRFSLNACRNNDVREAMATIWSNDNAECDLFANLFGLSYFAELCFDKDASKEKLVARFEACTGADYDAFYTMSFYHNSFGGEQDDYSNYSNRFLGKHIFWQDILEGLYDTHLFAKKMSGHYAMAAEKMQTYKGGRWDYLYEFAYRVFDFMATKTLIAENLVPAYKSGDKETLAEIASELLPTLKEKTIALHKSQKDMWFSNRNMIGWCNMDVRYAGVAARCDTAKELIEAYLNGQLPTIESLDEERLPKPIGGFSHYSGIATPNLKT